MAYEIKKFEIENLFDNFNHTLDFSEEKINPAEARICIVVGKNGIGKTTVLNMIEGMLELDFNPFRKIPFNKAILELSTGDILKVVLDADNSHLKISYNEFECLLHANDPGPADPKFKEDVEILRQAALPTLSKVSFEKLDIHRSIALRERDNIKSPPTGMDRLDIINGKLRSHESFNSLLSGKVRRFVREAQVDYKKYFTSEGPSLFPRILKRLKGGIDNTVTIDELIARLNAIKSSESEMSRFGLTLNMSDINQLTQLLESDDEVTQSTAAIAALEAYVETLESKHEERCLISSRLTNFERLINGFFEGKRVLIDYDNGLKITTTSGKDINELLLSSGEYHLLYMLVTALVSTRTGTAIAIDEPELSLHVSWQRKLIKALIECSSGASPLFIFATHAPSIASEYQDKWISLGN